MKNLVFYVNNLLARYENINGELAYFIDKLSSHWNVILVDYNSRLKEVFFPYFYDVSKKSIFYSEYCLDVSNIVICRSVGSIEPNIDKFRLHLLHLKLLGCLVINDVDAMIYGVTKHYLLYLQGCGIQVIPTMLLTSKLDYRVFIDSCLEFSNIAIIKPITGECGNSFIQVCDLTESLFRHKSKLISTWIVQPLIPEISNGEYSYVVIGGEISHVFKKIPKIGQYRVNTAWSDGHEYAHIDPICKEIISKILNVWPYRLISMRVDFVYNSNNEPLIMEVETVNPGFGFKVASIVDRCLEMFVEVIKKYE